MQNWDNGWKWSPDGPTGEVLSNVSGVFNGFFSHVDHKVLLDISALFSPTSFAGACVLRVMRSCSVAHTGEPMAGLLEAC